jgi:electron transfer flavoprotein beta subunit
VDVLVCIKRVPETGARIALTADEQEIDTSYLGFTISPHEECAVEEALRLVAAHGGSATALTLGPPEASEQLRNAIAMGAESAILLETDGSDWDPQATAAAIVDAARDGGYDLLLFGNESADSGGYQVGIRVAHALGLPCVTGIKSIAVDNGVATVRREAGGGWEIFEVALPAVFTVKEGINLPRYPSLPGRLRAKKTEIRRHAPARAAGGLRKLRLVVPEDEGSSVEFLGDGASAAPRVVEVLRELGFA